MTAPSSSDVLLWVLCAVVVGTAFRKVWPFIRQFVHVVDLLSELPARLDGIKGRLDGQDEKLDLIGERFNAQDEVIEEIRHEVTTNNGSSVKDAVNRTEAALADHLEWSKADTEHVSGRLARIEAHIAEDIDQN